MAAESDNQTASSCRWLVEPDPDQTRAGEEDGPEWDAGAYYGVAVTGKGQIALYAAHVNDAWPATLETAPELDNVAGAVPDSIYQAAEAAHTGAVRLDI